MAEFRERPLRRGVTLGAVAAEQTMMPILALVARGAIQQQLLTLQLRGVRRRAAFMHPGDKRMTCPIVRRSSLLALP